MSGTSIFGQALQAIRQHCKETEKFAASSASAAREHRERYEGWQIEISQKKIGVTVSRPIYSAAIWKRRTNTRDFLSGFASRQAALEAVRLRIRELNAPEKHLTTTAKVCGPLKRR